MTSTNGVNAGWALDLLSKLTHLLQMVMKGLLGFKTISPSGVTPGQSEAFGEAVTRLDAIPNIEKLNEEKLNETAFVDQITAHQEKPCAPNFEL